MEKTIEKMKREFTEAWDDFFGPPRPPDSKESHGEEMGDDPDTNGQHSDYGID
jgi:hypothetical protein